MNFRAFIMKQLKIAGINTEHQQTFTDQNGMDIFTKAVTHPTFDANKNYQELEFIGDGIIKGILSQYIPRRFPDLASGKTQHSRKGTGEGVLSKTRRFLEQRKALSDFALKRGFWEYVKADDETKEKLRKETLEDVFEAFIGALVEVVDERVMQGLGYLYAYRYVKESLDEIEIKISAETLDDPITRLNELYKANELKDNKPPLKWGDAAYANYQIQMPKLNYKPQPAMQGQIIFYIPDKIPLIWDGRDWVHVTRAPLINLSPYPLHLAGIQPPPEGERSEDIQMMWYAGVYGFPKGPRISLDRVRAQQISDNPNIYGAEIIGQGLAFKKVDSKKMAAMKALAYMKGMGFEKN